MKYFDFVMSEVHGLRIQELVDAKAQGRKIVGSYCAFVPEELILAVDGISVGLCTGADFAHRSCGPGATRNTCSLIKSASASNWARFCPYVEACDMVVAKTLATVRRKRTRSCASSFPTLR